MITIWVKFEGNPEDFWFRYDIKKLFNEVNGWELWYCAGDSRLYRVKQHKTKPDVIEISTTPFEFWK